MEVFKVNRKIAQLIILQRIELASPFLKRLRKLFGRYIFSNFFSKYFINISEIGHKYYLLMKNEYEVIQNFLKPGQNILSVGSGIGGLELLVSKKNLNTKVSFVEKNYISKKIIYGWDDSNLEAYNNLNLLEEFLLKNNMEPKSFQIFDFDKDELPKEKFDLIISIYSLDFHYNFELYRKYFQEASNNETIIIFDTIRPEYFKNIFHEVSIIKIDNNTIHKSKRIACRHFIK
tara:strand:+ start:318 stop:1013 length:696 start_codon:yes stop_codon:yes gene_type:complete